jgi:hypothetical protein
MTWWTHLESQSWRAWLIDLAGPGQSRIPTGQPLDPFSTSTRSLSSQVIPWLRAIAKNETIPGERRPEQTVTDLAPLDLVEPERATPALTPFGSAVVSRLSGVPETYEFELAMAVGLLKEALIHNASRFLDMLALWWDVFQIHGDQLLADPAALLLLSYLDQTRVDFNPWAELRTAGTGLSGGLDWPAIHGSVANPGATTAEAFKKLEARTTADRRRHTPRVVFCTAMTLVLLDHANHPDALKRLDSLSLPVRNAR